MYNEAKINTIKKSKPFKLADIIMFAASVVLIVVMFLSLYAFGKSGAMVEVHINGIKAHTYNLTEELQEIKILGGKMTLHIENYTVWVHDVDCPDKLCKLAGKKALVNQEIVCLPNLIQIKIVGESKDGGIIII